MSDEEMRRFPEDLGKLGFVFNFITYGGHQIDGLAAEEFAAALKQDGLLSLARLQRKFRLVDSPYKTPQTLVGGARADAGLMACSGGTAATKAMGKGSTQHQHLVQTEVPTKLLEEWLAVWTKHHRLPSALRVGLRPHTAGSELLELSLFAPGREKVANVIFALSVVYTPRTAMLIRSIVLSLREQDYVQAARALGRADRAIAVRHILPNCLAPVLVQASFIFAYAILAEAILGFLGVGVPPYVPSWGNVIASGKNVIREAFWVSLFPGLALTVAGLSLNLLGDGLRDTLDPRLRGRS